MQMYRQNQLTRELTYMDVDGDPVDIMIDAMALANPIFAENPERISDPIIRDCLRKKICYTSKQMWAESKNYFFMLYLN